MIACYQGSALKAGFRDGLMKLRKLLALKKLDDCL
jgi:hypothetical protein